MCKYFIPNRNQNLCFRNYVSKWNFFKSNHVLKSTQLNSVITVEVYIYMCKCMCAIVSVMSNCSRPYVLQPIRLFCPWDSPSKNTGVGCHFLLQCKKSESEVAESCLTFSDTMEWSLPSSSVHGIFQARVLEWFAIAWQATIHGVAKSRTGLIHWTELNWTEQPLVTKKPSWG